MKKIAVLDSKGGTGKTTTVLHLSHAPALRGQSMIRNRSKKSGARDKEKGSTS